MKFILNRALMIGFNFLHRMAKREFFSTCKPMLKECTKYRSDYKWRNTCVQNYRLSEFHTGNQNYRLGDIK